MLDDEILIRISTAIKGQRGKESKKRNLILETLLVLRGKDDVVPIKELIELVFIEDWDKSNMNWDDFERFKWGYLTKDYFKPTNRKIYNSGDIDLIFNFFIDFDNKNKSLRILDDVNANEIYEKIVSDFKSMRPPKNIPKEVFINELIEELDKKFRKFKYRTAIRKFLEDLEKDVKREFLLKTIAHKTLSATEKENITVDKLFVLPNVSFEKDQFEEIKSTWGYVDSGEEIAEAYRFGMGHISEAKPWNEIKDKHERIMILADPGMGKTTLLLHEVEILISEAKEFLDDNEIEDVVLPIFIKLSELEESFNLTEKKDKETKSEKVFRAILDIIAESYSGSFTDVEQLILDKFKEGKILLLLDSLDEFDPNLRNVLSMTHFINL